MAPIAPVISLRHLRSRAQEAFWLLPAVCIVAAIILGLLLPGLDGPLGRERLFGGGPESARSFLSSITSAMITLTGLVFSITIVALQLAAGQFSSRVMRDFLRDRVIQLTFGVFVATFTYAMIMQRSVRGITGGETESVPQLGMSLAFVLVLGSVALFVLYINRVANSIRVANIVARIGTRTGATIEARYPPESEPGAGTVPKGQPFHHVIGVRSGVLISLNEQAIVVLAAGAGTTLVLLPRVGDYVHSGDPLFAQYDGRPCDEVLRHLAFDTERTYEQDVAFGFRELVDIAERALSPAVNDPTTAAQAIDILHDLLRQVAVRPPPPSQHLDEAGRLRLVTHPHTFPDLLNLAVEEIAHYGSSDIQTPRRLRTMLTGLLLHARAEYQPAILRWLAVIKIDRPHRPW